MRKKIKTELNKAAAQLDFLHSPGLEAEAVLAFALGKPRAWIIAHSNETLTEKQAADFAKLTEQRRLGVPLAYLTGEKEFYGLNFRVSPDTLVPRPETEMIVSQVIAAQPGRHDAVLDIGTGSGAIIISLAKQLPAKPMLLASDISKKALAVARGNAERHQAEIIFKSGNLLEPWLDFNPLHRSKRILICANLPYLPDNWAKKLIGSDSLPLRHEPTLALSAGKDGLDLYRQLALDIAKLKQRLPAADIRLYAEFSPEQATCLSRIFSQAKSSQIKNDPAGLDRLYIAKL